VVFVNVYIHFRIWTRIRNTRVTDPDPEHSSYGSRSGKSSGSTTLFTNKKNLRVVHFLFNNTVLQQVHISVEISQTYQLPNILKWSDPDPENLTRSDKKVRIRPDPDPEHCFGLKNITSGFLFSVFRTQSQTPQGAVSF
jgi:hypothetical protein